MTNSTSTLLILGATGDLTSRLLLPALGQLLTKDPGRKVLLIGAGREDLSVDDWQQKLHDSFATSKSSGSAVDHLLESAAYMRVDVTKPADMERLLAACEGSPAIYFALPPTVTMRVCDALADVKLPDEIRLALEKPFGTDEESASALNAQLRKLVPEDQIHRVDHFLGRSTVFNLLGLRFANRLFEPVWNREHIESVDIVYDEQLALESRAGYYDHAGALVDMIQSHLLQVLGVLAMEPPATRGEADFRDAKSMVLRATRAYGDDPVSSTRRARYAAGKIGEASIPSYVDEDGVDPGNDTETLAEATFEIDNWRWAGVPFTLRSGKALGERRREVVVRFKQVPHLPTGLTGLNEPTVLRIMLAPDEMSLEININGEGDPFDLERVSLDASFGAGQMAAYGEVLEGILEGDPSLSVRGDTAEQCWRIVAPILQAWRDGDIPLEEYVAGSDGPSAWAPLG